MIWFSYYHILRHFKLYESTSWKKESETKKIHVDIWIKKQNQLILSEFAKEYWLRERVNHLREK